MIYLRMSPVSGSGHRFLAMSLFWPLTRPRKHPRSCLFLLCAQQQQASVVVRALLQRRLCHGLDSSDREVFSPGRGPQMQSTNPLGYQFRAQGPSGSTPCRHPIVCLSCLSCLSCLTCLSVLSDLSVLTDCPAFLSVLSVCPVCPVCPPVCLS